VEAQERMDHFKKKYPITHKEKSSEMRSPRVLEVEKGFQGKNERKTVERVAKP
jgi:hypothetical protein